MDMHEISCLTAICEEQSITRAANRLFISQPTLSKFLSNVEKRMGVQIFDRTTTPLQLTEFGEIYMDTAEKITLAHLEMERQISDIQNAKVGHLRVGVSPVRASSYLPKVIPTFYKNYPNIKISLVEDSGLKLEEHLLRGKVDLIITSGMLRNKDKVRSEIIDYEKIYFTTPKNYLPQKGGVPFKQIAYNAPWDTTKFILLNKHQKVCQIADRIFYDHNIVPDVVMRTRSSEMALRLSACNIGVCFISEATKNDEAYKDMDVDYYIVDEKYFLPVVVAYRKNCYFPQSAKYFLEILYSL